MKMRGYFAPAYATAEIENESLGILGISLDFIDENNSVIITQDAEDLFN